MVTATQARDAIGGLSNTSKMPGLSMGLAAKYCNIGGKLRSIVGSVCSKCYAFKGRSVMPNVKDAHEGREAALYRQDWVRMPAIAIGPQRWFRWHDSGDIRSLSHLIRIVAVAHLRPDVKFWIPTREYAVVTQYLASGATFPKNLVLRMSAPMVGKSLPARAGLSSMVLTKGAPVPAGTYICDASHTYKDGTKAETITRENRADLGHCGACRACWSPNNLRTAYPIH